MCFWLQSTSTKRRHSPRWAQGGPYILQQPQKISRIKTFGIYKIYMIWNTICYCAGDHSEVVFFAWVHSLLSEHDSTKTVATCPDWATCYDYIRTSSVYALFHLYLSPRLTTDIVEPFLHVFENYTQQSNGLHTRRTSNLFQLIAVLRMRSRLITCFKCNSDPFT